jgi:hypothetical protein
MAVKVTKVERVRFPKSKNVAAEKVLLAQLSKHRWKANQFLDTYRNALKLGGSALERASHYVVRSFSVKFTSAIIQNKRRPFHRRATLVELEEVARDLRLEHPCMELVRTSPKFKLNGDFRAICDFEHAYRTGQTVGRRMMQRATVLHPWQYDVQGIAAAIEAARQALLSGKVFGVIIDIKNFFGSFDQEALREELPVPVKLVDNYLVGRMMKVVPRVGHPPLSSSLAHALLSKARSGVPHGSSASPIIGAYTISGLAWQPSPGIVAIWYVDDVLLLAASLEEVDAAAKGVCAALSALPTGHFDGIKKWIGHASEGFDFLGHNVRLVETVEVRPLKNRLDEFMDELTDRCTFASEAVIKAANSNSYTLRPAALQAIADVWQYAEGWLNAFRCCDDIELLRVDAATPIYALLSKVGGNLASLKPYMSEKFAGGYPE